MAEPQPPTAADGQDPQEQIPQGWDLTPTPCPECGAPDEVLVRPLPGAEDPAQGEFRCRVCQAQGPAKLNRTEP